MSRKLLKGSRAIRKGRLLVKIVASYKVQMVWSNKA